MKSVIHHSIEKIPSKSVGRKPVNSGYRTMLLLPLTVLILWLGIILINTLIIDNSINSYQQTINNKQAGITTNYSDTILKHSELVVKTNELSGVVEKDIQPEKAFTLEKTLFPSNKEFNIIGFGRQSDGSFNVTIATSDYINFAKVARRFSNYDQIKNVHISNVTYSSTASSDQGVTGTISFFFVSGS